MLFEPHKASEVQSCTVCRTDFRFQSFSVSITHVFFLLHFCLSLLFIFGLFVDILFLLNPGTHFFLETVFLLGQILSAEEIYIPKATSLVLQVQ